MDSITVRFRHTGIDATPMEVANVDVAISNFESHANTGTPSTMVGEMSNGEKL